MTLLLRESLRACGKISFVSGNFNVLHPGHLRLLRFASEIGDALVVGLNPNGTPGVSVDGSERLQNISGLNIVAKAVLLDVPVAEFIADLQPDIVVKGKEFEDEDNPEEDAVNSYGGQLIFSSGEMRFSSMALLESEFKSTILPSIQKFSNFPGRYGFGAKDLKCIVDEFKKKRMVVIGDLIVDDYITCEPLGMSQEDPTIVVSPLEEKRFVGGAGVVSAHARSLGADVRFFTVTGVDEAATHAQDFISGLNIHFHQYLDYTRPTTLKQRYRANGKTLLRVNHLRQHDISENLCRKITIDIEAHLDEIDVLLFSDFNYGCLPQTLVESISSMARERGILMGADSQASSQLSDISRFHGMRLITPTEREARLALNDTSSGLAVLASKLAEKSDVENVIITLGSEGMLIRGWLDGEERVDRLPAFNDLPRDVAGAGDSLFTTTSLALACGAPIWQSAYIGAIAAACQTARVGNAPLNLSDILEEIETVE